MKHGRVPPHHTYEDFHRIALISVTSDVPTSFRPLFHSELGKRSEDLPVFIYTAGLICEQKTCSALGDGMQCHPLAFPRKSE